jgi:AcrR family transcriptional regulator
VTLRSDPSHGRPLGRRERKKQHTRLRIFAAAFDLFAQKGFEATTVEEIAERADVGKGTVFNYFPHKTAFLIAAYSEWVGLIRERLGPVESWQGPVRAQLGRVFGYLVDLAVQHRSLARLVVFENMRAAHERMTVAEARGPAGRTPGPASAADSDLDQEAVRILEIMTQQVVQKGKARAEVRPEVDESQAASLVAAAVFHTLVRGLLRNESARKIKTSLAAQLEIIFTGLAP